MVNQQGDNGRQLLGFRVLSHMGFPDVGHIFEQLNPGKIRFPAFVFKQEVQVGGFVFKTDLVKNIRVRSGQFSAYKRIFAWGQC